MRDAAAHGAIWVCGPAGAGKTTAVAQWLRTSRRNTLWLRLDAADSDPGVLLPRLRDAIAGHGGGSATTFAYGPEHREQLTRFARLLFRTLFARLRKPLTWVLDNVHEVDAAVADPILAAAMEEAPEALTVVAISRGEPGAAFARNIACRQLTVIGRDELKFSLDEASALFGKRALKLPADAIARCRDELDGWAVGLVFASDSLRHDDAARDARPGAADAPALMNYLAADVFDHLPVAQRAVLQATALLPRFTADEASQLARRDDAAAALADLHRHSGFVELEDANAAVYRVHPVFRAFLQRHFDANADEARRDLLSRSAELLRAGGQLASAATLLARDGQHERIADLVEDNALALLRRGRDQTVVELLRTIPADHALLAARPWLQFWLAEALALTDPHAARDAALQAEQRFNGGSRHDDALGQIVAAGTLLSLHRAMRVEMPSPLQIAERCERAFLAHWQQVPEPFAIYAAAAYLSAVSTLNRGEPIAPDILAWLLAALHSDGPANLRLRTAVTLYEQFYTRNDLAGARRVELAASALCNLPEARASAQRLWLVALSIGYVYQRRLPEAEAVLERAAQLAEQLGDIESECHVNAWRIIVRTRLRRAQDALPLALSGRPDFAQVQPLMRATLLWAEANLYIALRQYDTALARFDAAIHLYEETGTNVEQGPMLWLGQSVCRLMLGRHEAALASLQPLLASGMGGMSRQRLEAFMLAIRASVALTRGDAGVRGLLVQAFAALRDTDYRDVMYGAESAVAELCAAALREGIEPEFADALIRHRQLEAPDRAPAQWPFAVRIRCLGELHIETRETEGGERALRKSVELLQQVLAAWPQPVAIDPLIARLWPGDGREGAQKAFDAALHRLRKRLGADGALRLSERRLSLNGGVVHVDLQALDQALAGDADPARQGERLLGLYRDHLLPGVADLARERARLWTRVRAALLRAADAARDAGDSALAARIGARVEALDSGVQMGA